jgi:ABC-type sugar transport system ATPase subunit
MPNSSANSPGADHPNPPVDEKSTGGPGPVVLSCRGIGKVFPGVRALDGVNLDLRQGEVHALLGENGAGKSTLIKILAGIHRPDSGAVAIDDEAVSIGSPTESQKLGISVIAQELELVPTMSVVQNIFLGHEVRRRTGLLDWPKMRRQARELFEGLGVEISVSALIEELPVADRQLVEIAKALSVDFQTLILDEPTAALNAADVERLLTALRRLRGRGIALLYVSHRLDEIKEIADVVTVLRDGKVVGGGDMSGFDEARLAELIVGRAVQAVEVDHSSTSGGGEVALEVRGLELPGILEDIDFDLHYGEVLGVAGLVGSGRAELTHAVVGTYPDLRATIRLDGEVVELKNPRAALGKGICFLSEDRKAEGILPDLTVRENLVIGRERKFTRRIKRRQEEADYRRMKNELGFRSASPNLPITSLSGGNQQRVLIGRALLTESRVLVLSEPTRGVDIGARIDLHKLLRGLAAEGYAIMVSSSDVNELVSVSDRCIVLSGGRQIGMLVEEQIDEQAIIERAIGTGQGAAV